LDPASFDLAVVGRFDPGPELTIVGVSKSVDVVPLGSRWPLDDLFAPTQVLRTGRSARIRADDLASAGGEAAEFLRRHGYVSQVACPIVVEGRNWGAMTVAASNDLPPDTEERLERFTELVATAIANAESSAELAASRRRIVAASDDARRRIERDLHDGVQQQLVSLGLELGTMKVDPPTGDALKEQLARASTDVVSVLDALVELARGIHPAILSRGGLAAALRVLARRSAVPVELVAQIDGKLPDDVEVAAYFVAAEALTNTAKHARASVVHLEVTTADGTLTLMVRDDGVGGARPGDGSGLIGLQDRVEALGGTIKIDSAAGRGTCVVVTLPIATEPGREVEPALGAHVLESPAPN
jgi:signal transduction histidine kinase